MADPAQIPRVGVDVVAGSAIVASFMDWLPKIAGLIGATLSIIWFLIQIWESHTIQKLVNRWLAKHRTKRLTQMQAKQKMLMAKIDAAKLVQDAKAEAARLVVRQGSIEP